MTDDLDLDLGDDSSEKIISRKDKKIDSLSEKLGISEKEKAETATKAETEAKARADAEKERDFFKGFNQVQNKYAGASEYQDRIFEKVKAGYDVEDATISILAKEGKFTTPPPAQESATGGSAATTISSGGDKSPGEMTQDERRSALLDAEAKGEFRL